MTRLRGRPVPGPVLPLPARSFPRREKALQIGPQSARTHGFPLFRRCPKPIPVSDFPSRRVPCLLFSRRLLFPFVAGPLRRRPFFFFAAHEALFFSDPRRVGSHLSNGTGARARTRSIGLHLGAISSSLQSGRQRLPIRGAVPALFPVKRSRQKEVPLFSGGGPGVRVSHRRRGRGKFIPLSGPRTVLFFFPGRAGLSRVVDWPSPMQDEYYLFFISENPQKPYLLFRARQGACGRQQFLPARGIFFPTATPARLKEPPAGRGPVGRLSPALSRRWRVRFLDVGAGLAPRYTTASRAPLRRRPAVPPTS